MPRPYNETKNQLQTPVGLCTTILSGDKFIRCQASVVSKEVIPTRRVIPAPGTRLRVLEPSVY